MLVLHDIMLIKLVSRATDTSVVNVLHQIMLARLMARPQLLTPALLLGRGNLSNQQYLMIHSSVCDDVALAACLYFDSL